MFSLGPIWTIWKLYETYTVQACMFCWMKTAYKDMQWFCIFNWKFDPENYLIFSSRRRKHICCSRKIRYVLDGWAGLWHTRTYFKFRNSFLLIKCIFYAFIKQDINIGGNTSSFVEICKNFTPKSPYTLIKWTCWGWAESSSAQSSS